jgi:long-chain acyl-CoA synthetase
VDLQALPDLLTNLVASHQKTALLRYKEGGAYRDLSTAEVERRVRLATLGLRDAGIERGDRVGILAENRPEWILADLAIQCLGAVNVPVYPTLLQEQVQFILGDSGTKAVFCSTAAQAAKVAAVRAHLPQLRTVVSFDPPRGQGCVAWTDLSAAGARLDASHPRRFDDLRSAVQPQDLASIIYTSGTTGVPKGVMLTHANFISNVRATVAVMPITEDDVVLSFLPLSHVFERMVAYAYLSQGTTIAFAESMDSVPRNLVEVRPTIAAAVPRVFEKFYARVMEAVGSGSVLRKRIFFWAVAVGRRRVPYLLAERPVPAWLGLQVALAERLVFRKVRERVGGRLHYFISGSAPLAAHLAEFFWGVGLPVFEGYGLTETSPVIAVNRPGRVRLGTVGPAVPGVEVRIAGDGEILVRGPNVMQGYYRNEEANKQAFDAGWLCTGDIGEIDGDGFLSITDRKKDVIKTSGGKMIAPQPVENALKQSKYIANAVVVGERRKFISALLVPNFENLARFCHEHGLAGLPLERQLEHAKVLARYQKEIDRAMGRLARFEQIKAFRLLPRDFTLEDGEITPTLKVRRNVVEHRYQALIGSMYPDETGGPARR